MATRTTTAKGLGGAASQQTGRDGDTAEGYDNESSVADLPDSLLEIVKNDWSQGHGDFDGDQLSVSTFYWKPGVALPDGGRALAPMRAIVCGRGMRPRKPNQAEDRYFYTMVLTKPCLGKDIDGNWHHVMPMSLMRVDELHVLRCLRAALPTYDAEGGMVLCEVSIVPRKCIERSGRSVWDIDVKKRDYVARSTKELYIRSRAEAVVTMMGSD